MAGQSNWAKIGRVAKSHNTYRAEVDTYCLGERYKITGPPRGSDEHKAYDDLLRIRASAEQALTRPEGLELMKSMARELRDAATAVQPNLNNLYGLTQPPDRRRLFCARLAKGRRVSRNLFVNWFHIVNFLDPFATQS